MPTFDCDRTWPWTCTPLVVCALTLLAPLGPAQAQMKIGRNPASLASNDIHLQVEATDGSQVVVRKGTAQMGIGTAQMGSGAAPANTLEVDSGSTSAGSGVRLTQLKSAPLLATNANGDLVKTTSTSGCTCGDIRISKEASLGGDWQLMNGSQGAGSCAIPAVDATGRVLVMKGVGYTMGQTNSPTLLVQSQLPNITIEGAPTYWGVGDGGSGSLNTLWTSSQYNQWFNANQWQAVMAAVKLNGGVTQTPLSIANVPRIRGNYFVCVK